MRKPCPLPRDELIQLLISTFRSHGYDGTTTEVLVERTGLSREELASAFPGGRVEMATAVLDALAEWMGRTLITPLYGPGTPRERIAAMAATLDGFYRSGDESCLLATFSIGEARGLFHQRIRAGTTAWIEALAQPLRDAGLPAERARERAEDGIVRIQGALIVARAMHDPEPFARAVQRLPQELLDQA